MTSTPTGSSGSPPSHDQPRAAVTWLTAIGDDLEQELRLLMSATAATPPDISTIQRHAQTLWHLVQSAQAAGGQGTPATLYEHNPKQIPY